MNAQKTNAEKINNRYLYAINFISKLTTCYYIFEGIVSVALCGFMALLDYFLILSLNSFSVIIMVLLLFGGLNSVYIALEIISELRENPAAKVNIYIINFIVKLLFSAVEMKGLNYFMLPHVCVFIASAVALVLCILYKIKSKNQSSHT
ncbi:MAG: hypothetical protein HDQ97_05400 [Lachnospiraceae bacterium]|nr:hypothetical protein [Lachnospiraceae bacterium]